MTIGHFLGGIAALIWDRNTSEYLVLRRAAAKDFKAGDWECVTGRVDQGESYLQALQREVLEEIGVKAQVEFIIGLTHFYRGAPVPENELQGVVIGCTLSDRGAVRFGDEHSEMAWMSVSQLQELVNEDHWLWQAVTRAEHLRRLLPDELRHRFREEGFEF